MTLQRIESVQLMKSIDILACLVVVVCMSVLCKTDVCANEPISNFVSFEKSVAPILSAKCVSCHRPDNLKGGFDLTTRATALKGGENGTALVPGKPDDSPLYTRAIPHNGQPPEMPAKGESLTKVEAEALKEWITDGADWPETNVLREKSRADASFWSFQPIAKMTVPNFEDAPECWNVQPIDRFIFAKLRESGLKPNSPASPETLIRRATFDLTGLPPMPEEVAEFVRLVSEKGAQLATEQLIDRLLESPRYGEAWGRHWLDVIRFGESRGYERNEIITNLWPFRDYVIRSFNDDKPFDQFIREHLAGDIIGKNQPDIEVGSAFLVAGPYDDVGNQDPAAAAQIRADQMDEMIRATSEAFLGLTMGCARCHDHKFDPLQTRDYYSLYATFNGTVHGPREVATVDAHYERNNRLAPLHKERTRLTEERKALDQAIIERIKQQEPKIAKTWIRPRQSRYLTEELFEPAEATFVRLIADGTDAPDPNRKQFKIDEFEVWTDEAVSQNVALSSAGGKAMGAAPKAKDFGDAYSADHAIDGKYGECWHANSPELVIQFSKPERIKRVVFSSDRTRALSEDHPNTVFVGDYRIEASNDGKTWTTLASSADRVPSTDIRRQARLRKTVMTDAESERLATLDQAIGQLDAQISQVPALPVWWVGTHREAPGPFAVFVGGNPQRRGDEVVPASLTVLNGYPSQYRLDSTHGEAERRLALANWLTAPDHPLVARVLANRIWQFHFGTGIVNTPSDFGYMGGRPTHPELLDWLAQQLLTGGWKLKPLHRQIMTSQAYRQASTWQAERASQDADSRLLWRFPPRRLTAEEIRDSILSISGKLDLTMGGPGFRLYEYQQDNVATYVPLNDCGPETYRRAVYHHNARASRIDVLTDFDCPDPAFAEPRRAATTTPLQALTLMNHRFSVTMADSMADRLRHDAKTAKEQVRRAFVLAVSRAPSDSELTLGVELINKHGVRAFCRVLLNSNELIHLD